MRVLITGASGFIGGHLARVLAERGDDVTCLVRKTSRTEHLESLPVTMAFGDITDAESLREPLRDKQVVYHVAGCVHALNKRQFFEINERGTGNVAGACARQSDPPVLVVVSSLAAAGPAPDTRPLREDHTPAPVSYYGRSKLASERAAAKYADRVPITIVRPACVFGEGDRDCLEMFRPIDRFHVHFSPRRMRVSMIHVADLIDLLILAANRGRRIEVPRSAAPASPQGCYFAACDEYPTYAELGRMMARALGRRVLILPIGRPAFWTGAVFNELVGKITGRPLAFNIDKAREVTARRWLCSPQTAIDELGFSLGASLAERLDQTVRWYRAEGWL